MTEIDTFTILLFISENSAQSYAKKIAITVSISGFVSFLIMVILLKRKDRDMYALIKSRHPAFFLQLDNGIPGSDSRPLNAII